MRLMHLGRLSLALWHLRQLLLGRHYHAARSLTGLSAGLVQALSIGPGSIDS